ncbi:MAG: hypothetical protein VKO64_09305 [Candidatus Sericytochromatia bacterium]|nr:hypothetical protein [Candidatus Sericytochromatia bacterium]
MSTIKANTPLAQKAAPVKVENQTFDFGAIAQEVGMARKTLGEDKFKAENPGMWQRTKEVFSSGAKKERLQKIENAEAFEKLFDQLMNLVAKASKAVFGEA